MHAAHQEDVVVDPERDEEDEADQRQAGVDSAVIEDVIEDEHALYFGVGQNADSLVPRSNVLPGKIKYENWFHRWLTKQIY